jgi:hypothetical protein
MFDPIGRLGIFGLAALILVGCGIQDGAAGKEAGTRVTPTGNERIIVKLRDPARDPASAETLHELSRQAGLSFAYLRPLSGGAHLLQIEGIASPEAVDEALGRLRASPGVEYVEPDQLMRHQQPPGQSPR